MLQKGSKLLAILMIISLVLVTGCSPKEGDINKEAANIAPQKIRISLQYGLGYAPLQIVKEKKLIEKYLPGIEVEWKQLGTGGLIREALISGDLDAGFMGIPPYLVAWDKGADWKIATGLASAPLGLQTYKKDINTLSDFKPEDKIVVPIPGSIQHILLAMGAEKELGNPKALDNNLVSMAHPDGTTALINESVTAHFTSPPYVFKEMESENIKQVLDAEKAFGGEFTFLVGVVTKDFHDKYPAAYAAFVTAMSDAITYINNNPKEAAEILAPQFKLSESEAEKYLTWPGTNYTSTAYGLMGFAEFMQEAGYISKVPKDFGDVVWENVEAAIGKKAGAKSTLEQAQYRK